MLMDGLVASSGLLFAGRRCVRVLLVLVLVLVGARAACRSAGAWLSVVALRQVCI